MAGNDAAHPFQEDFLQTIKEVHWGEPQNFLVGGLSGTSPHLEKSFDGIAWSANPAPPIGGSLGVFSLAYGEKAWIATGANTLIVGGGDIFRSIDGGKSWTSVAHNTSSFDMVAFGKVKGAKHGTFVAMTNGNGLLVSQNGGASWSAIFPAPVASESYNSCNFAGNQFFLITTDNAFPFVNAFVYRSQDGISWKRASIFSSLSRKTQIDKTGVAYNDKTKTFSAVCRYQTFDDDDPINLQFMATTSSRDGSSWSGSTLYGDGGRPYKFGAVGPATIITPGGGTPIITGGNGVFVLCALSRTATFFGASSSSIMVGVSPNGAAYSLIPVSTVGNSLYTTGQTVNFSKTIKAGKQAGLFMLAGLEQPFGGNTTEALFTSPDGSSWSRHPSGFTTPGPSNPNGVRCSAVGKLPKK